jgi:hypothetical protein
MIRADGEHPAEIQPPPRLTRIPKAEPSLSCWVPGFACFNTLMPHGIVFIPINASVLLVASDGAAEDFAVVALWFIATALWVPIFYVAGRFTERSLRNTFRRAQGIVYRLRIERYFGPKPPRAQRGRYAERLLGRGVRVYGSARVGSAIERVPGGGYRLKPSLAGGHVPTVESARENELTPETEVIDRPTTIAVGVLGWLHLAIAAALAWGWCAVPFHGRESAVLVGLASVWLALGVYSAITGVRILGSDLPLRTVTADPLGVEVSPLFGRSQRFSPADSVILVQGRRWPGLVFVQLLRTDGVTRRVACWRAGFEHLIACWSAGGERAAGAAPAEPDATASD